MHHITLGYHTEHGVDEVYLSIPRSFTTLPQEIIQLINQDPNMHMSLCAENILNFSKHNVIDCGEKYRYWAYEGILLQAAEKYPGVTIRFEQLLQCAKRELAAPSKTSTTKHAGYSITFEEYAIVISLDNKCSKDIITECAQKIQIALNSSRLRVLGITHGFKVDFEQATICFSTTKNMYESSYELKMHIIKKIETTMQSIKITVSDDLSPKIQGQVKRKSFISNFF